MVSRVRTGGPGGGCAPRARIGQRLRARVCGSHSLAVTQVKKTLVPVSMPVVRVGVVRVDMGERRMGMRVGVARARGIGGVVRVLVMLVVLVLV